MSRLLFLSFCSLILFLVVPGQKMQAQPYEYGKVDFGVSCSESVQADFDRALAMLHNMMYETARNDFKKITEADLDCAMGHWGIATTLFQPLWGTRPSEDDLQQGWQTISQAQELVDSDRERYLIGSTAEFFREPESAEFWTRIQRWADAMEVAYEVYPNDPDIAALYGLSRLAIAQTASDRDPIHDEAEAILREIYEENPSHPGAVHYRIHATDVDGRAENGYCGTAKLLPMCHMRFTCQRIFMFV